MLDVSPFEEKIRTKQQKKAKETEKKDVWMLNHSRSERHVSQDKNEESPGILTIIYNEIFGGNERR